MKTNIILLIVFIVSMFVIVLCLPGCKTIPEMPQKDIELLRQAAMVNDAKAQRLLISLRKDNAPKEYQKNAEDIYLTAEAIVDWVGHPEEDYTGDTKKLVSKMHSEDLRYGKDMEGWTNMVSRYQGQSVGGNFFTGTLPWTMMFIVALGCGVFFVVARRIF